MAGSAPPPAAGFTNAQSFVPSDSAAELEIGMAGMSLIAGLPTNGRPPALVGSSISSVADHSRHHSAGSLSIPSAEPMMANFRGTPPSPVSPLQRLHYNNVPKPPGLGGPQLPSPIAKTSSGNNTATSSPNLTITPSSSVDGNHEAFSGFRGLADVRQSASLDVSLTAGGSPWAIGAVGTDLNDSYLAESEALDINDNDPEDGLRGLGALRERAQSSPGPMPPSMFSGSPPVRIDVSTQPRDLSPLHSDGGQEGSRQRERGLPPDPRRMRSARDFPRHSTRPPLAGVSTASQASQTSFPDTASSFSSVYNERTNTSFTQGSLSGLSSENNANSGRGSNLSELEKIQGRLTRSASLGTVGGETQPYDRNTHIESFQHSHTLDQHSPPPSSKFGTISSLTSTTQHSRIPHTTSHQEIAPGRHVRSYSASGPLQPSIIQGVTEQLDSSSRLGRSYEGGIQYRGTIDARDIGRRGVIGGLDSHRRTSTPNLSRSVSGGDHYGNVGMQHRGLSLHPPSAVDNQYAHLHRRNSDIVNSSAYGGIPQANHHLHSSLQFRDESRRFDDGGVTPVMATQDELRSFGIGGEDRQVVNRSPLSVRQLGRRHSDVPMVPAGAHVHSVSTPRSTSFSMQYANHGVARHPSASSLDEDLTHPLVGEHIDDPGDELGVSMNRHFPANMSPIGGIPHVTSAQSHMTRSPIEHRGHFTHIEPMMQLTAGATYSGPRHVYTVKFKRSQRNFIPGPRVTRDLKIGCYVKVEADRGEDLGIVVSRIQAEKLSGSGRSSFRGAGDMGLMGPPTAAISAAGIADLKRIIRLATHDEVSLLAVKRDEEEELLRVCRGKVRQRGLPMHVVDAEYQFDRHKLTFFFEAEGRIDFRELVRDLFSMYKTRIWMQQLDKNVSNAPAMNPVALPADYTGQAVAMLPQIASVNDPYFTGDMRNLEGSTG